MESLLAGLDVLFGCHHRHLSRVFTIRGRSYQVCCDCGAEFKYSLSKMSIEGRLPSRRRTHITWHWLTTDRALSPHCESPELFKGAS